MNFIDFVCIALVFISLAFFFLKVTTYFAKHPQKSTEYLKVIFALMFFIGLLIYCYCNYQIFEIAAEGQKEVKGLGWVNKNTPLFYKILYVVMQSVMDVGMMFYGRANSDVFYQLSEAKEPLYVMGFWLLHVTAFFTAASALLIRFGNDFLRWIRITKTKVSDIDLIFGINADSLVFGRNISNVDGNMLVYVDSVIREDYETSIRDIGGLTFSDNDAVRATRSFLQNIRVMPNKTRLRLYALSGEYDRNLEYAQKMSDSLMEKGILPDQTELVLLGTDEMKGIMFQSDEKQYGYGSVVSFDEYEMSARLLIHEYPLCNVINFDSNGRATENMNILIVGFGRIGHEVLRKVIANGQFEGSRFHATVYDPNYKHRAGFIQSQYPDMFDKEKYDINFEPQGGRGIKFFSYLQENASKLKYIVVCIDDRDVARDIAVHMSDRLKAMGHPLNVYTCDSKSVRCYSQYAKEYRTHWIYDSKLLYSGELDRRAKELNHRYAGGSSVNEDWKKCEYFERMSSRASVDYLMPLIRRMRETNAGRLNSEQRENLARSEHLRWCAFHYTFGYSLMTQEELTQRVKEAQNEIREFGKSSIRPTRDKKNMKHACLVDWDTLDEIARIENSMTAANRDSNPPTELVDEKGSLRRWVDMFINLMQDEWQKS